MKHISLILTMLCACLPTLSAAQKAAIIHTEDVKVPAADAHKFWQSRHDLAKSTAEESGCVRVKMFENLTDKNRFFIYEEFVDAAAVQAHTKSKACVETAKSIKLQCPQAKSTAHTFEILPQATPTSEFIIAVEIKVSPEVVEDFKKRTKFLRDNSNTEPQLITYELYQDKFDNTRFFLFERYKSRDAHKYHASQKYFTDWAEYCKNMGKKVFRTAEKYDIAPQK